MRRINKILIGLILIATMFLGIGYSAIQNITLEIKGAVTAEGSKGTATPYIPKNFSPVEGTSLETGYTIQDRLGNQYVWVEVPKDETVYNDLIDDTEDANMSDTTNEDILAFDLNNLTTENLSAIETELKEYTSTYRNGTLFTDTFYSTDQHGFADADAYDAHKNKMLESVFKNEGFYVGKYETGIADTEPDVIDTTHEARTAGGNTTQTPVIQANAYPYNFVTCSQAQALASSMESGEYTSSLMFGVQWDLVLKYLETKAVEQGTSQATIISELNTNSTSWGNYWNNKWKITNTSAKNYVSSWADGAYGDKDSTSKMILLSTGADSSFSKQGIYDFAGNVYEYTLEYTSVASEQCAIRGGVYNTYRMHYPAGNRGGSDMTTSSVETGFRVSIF